jgi:hypothetical protein
MLRQQPDFVAVPEKTPKSILKPYDRAQLATYVNQHPITAGEEGPRNEDDWSTLLDSAVQQLASQEREPRLDAYRILIRTLSEHQVEPIANLREIMGMFTQYIQRDVLAASSTVAVPSSEMATQALRLLATFVDSPRLRKFLPANFRLLILRHAVTVFEQPKPSKAQLIQYSRLLGQYHFTVNILSPKLAGRIIILLGRLALRIKGISFLAARLNVYRNFLYVAPSAMVFAAPLWVPQLVHAMVMPWRAIRDSAIDFGIDAGLNMGTDPTVHKILYDLLDSPRSNPIDGSGDSVTRLAIVLTEKAPDDEHGPYIAKMFSVIILFFRCCSRQLEEWKQFKSWLEVMQSCFNTNDVDTRIQANLAWNRLIYVLSPNEATSTRMLRMLRLPIIGQLESRADRSLTHKSRESAYSSLCCLLYYSMRASSGWDHLDRCWKEYVVPILVETMLREPNQLQLCLRILARWFHTGPWSAWNDTRGVQQEIVTPEELPALDAKWVRSRTSVVLKVFKAVFAAAPWTEAAQPEGISVQQVWQNFTATLHEAGRTELWRSAELQECVAHLCSFFEQIWNEGPTALGCSLEAATSRDLAADSERVGHAADENEFMDRFSYIVLTAGAALDTSLFTQKFLTCTTEKDFEAISESTNAPATAEDQSEAAQSEPSTPITTSAEQQNEAENEHPAMEVAASGEVSNTATSEEALEEPTSAMQAENSQPTLRRSSRKRRSAVESHETPTKPKRQKRSAAPRNSRGASRARTTAAAVQVVVETRKSTQQSEQSQPGPQQPSDEGLIIADSFGDVDEDSPMVQQQQQQPPELAQPVEAAPHQPTEGGGAHKEQPAPPASDCRGEKLPPTEVGGADGWEAPQSAGQGAVGGIIDSLKRVLGDLRRAVLGPQDMRQIDDLLFEVKKEAFAAEGRTAVPDG